jgi:hypothetical protein
MATVRASTSGSITCPGAEIVIRAVGDDTQANGNGGGQ